MKSDIKDSNYLIALDLSLNSTGVAVFSGSSLTKSMTIKPNKKYSEHEKIIFIGEELTKIRDKFPAMEVAIEKGFFRFIKASEKLNKVHGLAMWIFKNSTLTMLNPTTVKKQLTGTGKASKEELRDLLMNKYGCSFSSLDESDACAVGTVHVGNKKYYKEK